MERRGKIARTSDVSVQLVASVPGMPAGPRYRFAQTIVTRRVVELGLAPQRAPFVRGTSGYLVKVPVQYALIMTSSVWHDAVDDWGATTLRSYRPRRIALWSWRPGIALSPLNSFGGSEQPARASAPTNVTGIPQST